MLTICLKCQDSFLSGCFFEAKCMLNYMKLHKINHSFVVHQALVFEDAVNGVKAANAAGMQCVWVPAEWTDKTAEKATLTLSSLEEFNPAMFGLPPYKA